MTLSSVAAKWLLALAIFVTSPTTMAAPNIVFIVADDLGWNDVGYHNPDIQSPNIDSLVKTGIALNQTYTQPVCSPSRTAFMTGVYPFRLGLQHLVIGSEQKVCVPLNQTFLPQVLKKNGYQTHAIGKWHLGFCKWECTPTYRGFDSFYGFYNGAENYFSKVFSFGYDFRANTDIDSAAEGMYSTYQFAKRAENIIYSHNNSNPLFLYLAFQSVHIPLEVPETYISRYVNITNRNRRLLSGMVTSMDEAIGRVVRALKNANLYDDTIIVMTSDNGGWTEFGGNNFPLRGGKLTIFEGGTRVPAFVHSPLLPVKGATHTGMMHAVDWFPTLVEAAGIPYKDPNQDGISQWKPITTLGPSNRNSFVYNMDLHDLPAEGSLAIRVGDYKLVTGFPGLYRSWYRPNDGGEGPHFGGEQLRSAYNSSSIPGMGRTYNYLFNLRDDPTEHVNLYDQLPDVVHSLKQRLEQEKKRYVVPNYPDIEPMANPIHYGGKWSPGWC